MEVYIISIISHKRLTDDKMENGSNSGERGRDHLSMEQVETRAPPLVSNLEQCPHLVRPQPTVSSPGPAPGAEGWSSHHDNHSLLWALAVLAQEASRPLGS